jgi:hypothetical protein
MLMQCAHLKVAQQGKGVVPLVEDNTHVLPEQSVVAQEEHVVAQHHIVATLLFVMHPPVVAQKSPVTQGLAVAQT